MMDQAVECAEWAWGSLTWERPKRLMKGRAQGMVTPS